jgi:hypothetical protein
MLKMKVNGQLHDPPLYLRRNRPRNPLDRKLGGPQHRPGRCGKDEKLASAGNRNRAVAIPTELSRVLKKRKHKEEKENKKKETSVRGKQKR